MDDVWVKKFEKKFSIKQSESDIFRIIIGERPYLQRLNNMPFQTRYSEGLYSNFGQVAFLVNKWIKIQDSLEMLFNLLFTESQSIRVISYLKNKGITPEQFADYLIQKHNLILVNRYSERGNDNKTAILKIIKDMQDNNKKVLGLFVGQKSVEGFSPKDLSRLEYGVAIHSSGANLNRKSTNSRYFQTWYLHNSSQLYRKTTNFNLNSFLLV